MTFDADDGMHKKWKAFTEKIDTKTDDFKVVLKTIKCFLAEPFLSASKKSKYVNKWSAKEQIGGTVNGSED